MEAAVRYANLQLVLFGSSVYIPNKVFAFDQVEYR